MDGDPVNQNQAAFRAIFLSDTPPSTDVTNNCTIYNSDFTICETSSNTSYRIIINDISSTTTATLIYIYYDNNYYPYQVYGGYSYSVYLSDITPVTPLLGPISSIQFNNGKHNIHDARITGIDTTPTSGSTNVVTSGGVADAIPSTYAGSPTAGGFANKTVAIPFGAVDSTSTATEMTATVDNFPTTLTNGVCAYIRNDIIASASGWTLNINGTGALPVYASNADAGRTTTIFAATMTFLFVYNSTRVEGGCWDIYYGYDSNTNTIGYQVRTNSYSLPMKSITYRYRLLFTSADGEYFVPANNSSSTNATASRTVCQNPIDPFGKIVFYGTTASVAANARPAAANLWSQYALSLGYSFNRTGAALVLTLWKPVYVKCAPQDDGSAIIDSTTPYVQDLPTTKDGKIYIYLGVAYSATNIELAINHPVYYHDGTRATIWPGPVIGDIQTALDAIIGNSLISFTINDTTYQSEEGMTWHEWVSSAYNTGGFYSDGNNGHCYVRAQNGNTIMFDNVSEKSLNAIVNERAYTYNTSSGGND